MHARSLLPAALAAALLAGGAAANPAAADDEGSEHTASLVGAAADTLGVVVHFDERGGWSMDYRARPGAPGRRIALPFLPADHAHYAIVVGPGRAPLTFVMTSREQVAIDTPAIWVWAPADAGGKVTRTWTLGDLFTAEQLGKVSRSISHVWWQQAPLRLDGPRVIVDAGGRAFTIDPVRGTLTGP
jgi:hypothetical protein